MDMQQKTVRLTPYNQLWEKLFAQEKQQLQNALKEFAIGIEHIGSTSIRGIVAKPVIDILVGIKSLKDQDALEKIMIILSGIGYEWREQRSAADHLLFVKGPDDNRSHNLHLVEFNGRVWKEDIFFRDYLRRHPQEAKEFDELKLELAEKHAEEREKYSEGKKSFIDKILQLSNFNSQ